MLRKSVVVAVVLCSVLAHAESDDAIARARSHFEAGRALFQLKQYTDAIREFSAGYQLAPRPQFLVNLGQCYDKLAEGAKEPDTQRDGFQHSRDMYAKYLEDTAPTDKLRDQVTAIIADIDRKLAALTPAPRPHPVEVAPVVAPVEVKPAVVAVVETAPVPPPRKSFIRRNWWIFPVGAVVLAGAAVGIYFAVRPSSGVDCSSASLGCVPANQ